MHSSLYILCPGQGAQTIGMGKSIAETPAAKKLYEDANRILGFDLMSICFNGPEDRLNQTDISQPALFVVGVASFRSAVESGKFDEAAVTSYAGLSLGEYTALHLAGVFDFEAGLRLVQARGKYMQEAAIATPSGMVALVGADESVARDLCEKAAGGDVLTPANYNAPGQIVVSGSKAACERAVAMAETFGVRTTPLKVAGAFHSPLMQPAAEKMEAELDRVNFDPPRRNVYSNVTAAPHDAGPSIKDLLVRQIVSPVRWEQTMQSLAADVEAKFIELSPGRTLAGLARRINRRLAIESLG
ncbi:MAG: ACP S-malonyltransferase [Tepidisphaeraceae bacterium]|jgi:[acyl-carrier-protein] S-malonyltransferase